MLGHLDQGQKSHTNIWTIFHWSSRSRDHCIRCTCELNLGLCFQSRGFDLNPCSRNHFRAGKPSDRIQAFHLWNVIWCQNFAKFAGMTKELSLPRFWTSNTDLDLPLTDYTSSQSWLSILKIVLKTRIQLRAKVDVQLQ